MSHHLAAPLAAVARLASLYRLPADRLDVLKDGSNLLVHLAPAPVVLRVATFTGRIRRDPLPYLEREVSLVGWLAAAGAAVMPPADAMPPGPHVVDGWAMAAWRWVPHERGTVPSPHETLSSLDSLHEAIAAYPRALPNLGPARADLDLAMGFAIDEGILDAVAVDDIRARRAALLDELASLHLPDQALHGDAFPRNTLVTDRGIVWIDLEDACRGPRLWDLATLARSTGDEGVRREIASRYGETPVRLMIELRGLQVRVWQVLHDAKVAHGW